MPEAQRDEIVYCSLCNGNGHYRHGPCPACRGIGKIIIDRNTKWVYCSLCNGNGHYRHEPCPACRGVGKSWQRLLPQTLIEKRSPTTRCTAFLALLGRNTDFAFYIISYLRKQCRKSFLKVLRIYLMGWHYYEKRREEYKNKLNH